jgi:hypothetical protein
MDEARRTEVKRLRALAREYRMFGRKIEMVWADQADRQADDLERAAAAAPTVPSLWSRIRAALGPGEVASKTKH